MPADMNSEDFDRRGFELYESGDLEGALGIYQRGLDLFPLTPELHSGKGFMCLYLGEFVNALGSFSEGLRIDPGDPEMNRGAALSLLYLNRSGEADVYLEKALPHAKGDASALFEIGVALVQADRMAEAIPLFDEIIALDPDHSDAHFYRGMALHAAGTGEAGDKHRSFETALAQAPDRADLAEQYGNVLYEDGLRDRAASVFARLRPEELRDPTTVERMLEVFRGRRGTLWKRWRLRRRLKEIRRTDPVDEFLRGLQEEWNADEASC
jgi:tetratricopeptide (TPR) repeat protein